MIRHVRLADNGDDAANERELLLLPSRSPHPDHSMSGCSDECRLAARVRVDGFDYEVHQLGTGMFVPLGRNSRGALVHGPACSTMRAAIDAAL